MPDEHNAGGADDLVAFGRRVGHEFHDPGLLVEALTHSSMSGQGGLPVRTNERLEFLGDRVLGLVVADLLIAMFPNESEGSLARRHAALVRREALAEVAESVGLDTCLRMAPGEAGSGGRANPGLLADACEAVIAALYLDGGFTAAAAFVRRHWRPLAERDSRPPKDAKTGLQEWAQGRGLSLPTYTEVGRVGPAHAPRFRMQVRVEGRAPVTGEGPSKRVAEHAAAQALLDAIVADADE